MSIPAIGENSRVVMHYRISLEDGTVADSTWEDNEPLAFVMGDGTLMAGMEETLFGLKQGEQHQIHLSPDQAFGYKDTGNIHDLPRDDFDPQMPVEPGMVIGFTLPSGEELPGMVMDVGEAFVRVDFNHPFSGHELNFEVEILSVENGA